MTHEKMMDAMTTARERPGQTRGPALVVAGMHRSGTSAMARVLSLAGGALPERVIQPGPDNPLGFWEPWEMVALSDELLNEVGSAWDDPFAHAADAPAWERRDGFLPRAEAFISQNFGHQPFPVLKDPRASVLTRVWHQALLNSGYRPVYVIMVRHPLEVAGSLASRDGFPTAKSLLIWAAYMTAVERDTRGEPRVFVTYPDLISNGGAVLDRVETTVDISLPDRTAATQTAIDRFLSRAHRHHEADDHDLASPGVPPLIGTVYRWLQAAASGHGPDATVMDATVHALDELMATFQPIEADRARRAGERERALQAELVDAEARLIRARGHVREIEIASAARDAAADESRRDLEQRLVARTQDVEEADRRVQALTAELRSARLLLTGLETTLRESRAAEASALETLREERETHTAEVRTRDARIERLAAELETEKRENERQRQENERQRQELEAEWQARTDELAGRIRTMKQSLSWRVARPVRVIEGRLKRARNSGS